MAQSKGGDARRLERLSGVTLVMRHVGTQPTRFSRLVGEVRTPHQRALSALRLYLYRYQESSWSEIKFALPATIHVVSTQVDMYASVA